MSPISSMANLERLGLGNLDDNWSLKILAFSVCVFNICTLFLSSPQEYEPENELLHLPFKPEHIIIVCARVCHIFVMDN